MTEGLHQQDTRPGSVAGLPVVTPPVEVDVATSDRLRQTLMAALDDHATVVVDMSGNIFCDSSGIAALVMATKRARARGGDVRVVMRNPSVRRIFQLTGADRFLRNFESVDDATATGAAG